MDARLRGHDGFGCGSTRWPFAGHPRRSGYSLGVCVEHHVESQTDARAITAVGINRVLKPSGKNQQCSVLDIDDDLVGVLRGQLADGRADDSGLEPGIAEIDSVGAGMCPYVIDAAQIVVGCLCPR